ncbi:MAG TPA: Crp/Fnr family transcriptional regulator [Bacteroidetes bacterium]|nr:Crp/Fnr family transcriptional regulator [Bacteroidota bacterium]
MKKNISPALLDSVKDALNRYSELPEHIYPEFLDNMELGQLSKGQIIIHQGAFNDKVFLVIEGGVRAYHVVEDKEYTDWFALHGQFFSAISCYFQGIPSTHTYAALQQTTYLVCSKAFLEGLADQHHAVERLMRKIITESFLTLQNRVVYHRFKSAKARYEELLVGYPNLVHQVPMKHIASYLGISPETLSRIRAEQV